MSDAPRDTGRWALGSGQNGSEPVRLFMPEPRAQSPEPAERSTVRERDPFLLVLLPIACVLLFIALALGLVAIATASERSTAIDWEQERTAFVRDLDTAIYDTPSRDAKTKALEALDARAAALEKQYPKRAEPLVLHAWALRAQGDVAGGTMAGFSLGRQAVEKLEAALERDPAVYGAASYASLGALYADVGVFSSYFMKRARSNLEKALALDPLGAQQNLSLAWVSFKENDNAAALRLATAAREAPARPGREKADADLHERATALIAAVNDKKR